MVYPGDQMQGQINVQQLRPIDEQAGPLDQNVNPTGIINHQNQKFLVVTGPSGPRLIPIQEQQSQDMTTNKLKPLISEEIDSLVPIPPNLKVRMAMKDLKAEIRTQRE